MRRYVSLGLLLDQEREDADPLLAGSTQYRIHAFLGVEPVEGPEERFVYSLALPRGLPDGQTAAVGGQVNLQPTPGEPPMEFDVVSVKSPNANGTVEIILNRWLSGSGRYHYWDHVMKSHYEAQSEPTSLEGYQC